MIGAQAIYRVGMRYRSPLIAQRLKFLMCSQHWSRDEIRDHQNTTLAGLVNHAIESSEYYREYYGRLGISVDTVKTIDDLPALPLIEKADVLANALRIQVNNYPEHCFYSETSGSTGSPLVFYRNADWDAWHQASVMRGLAWHGVEPWDRNGYLWGYNLSFAKRVKTRALDEIQNRFRLFSYDNNEIDKFITKLRRAKYIGGYSSMIYEVAKRINETGRANELNLKFVRGTSEKILDSYQHEAQSAFGRKISSEYGAAESGIIAFECPEGAMHINSETTLVEDLEGKIAVTNLVSRSFPIIRYLLGDEIELDLDAKCGCGRSHPVLKEVTGRIGAKIVGHNSNYPSLTLYYVFKNLAQENNVVLNYQAVQDTRGKIELRIDRSLEEHEQIMLNAEITKYFGRDLDVDLVENSNLRSTTHKKRDFVSLL
ncbi:MAG: phenylacetate-CoA ligase [Gammaproteobacteria bacterium]|jgi:phenylacetate-CoA ligase